MPDLYEEFAMLLNEAAEMNGEYNDQGATIMRDKLS